MWFEIAVVVLLVILVLRLPTSFPGFAALLDKLDQLVDLQKQSLDVQAEVRMELAEVTRKLDLRWPEHSDDPYDDRGP